MAYTTIDLPTDYFNTVLWTGDGTSPKSFTGVGFQADMMWSKIRTDNHQHNIVDTVRGVDQRLLVPNSSNAEDTTCTHGHFDSLDSDGFTITGAGGYWNVNTNAENYVGWFWKGGGTASSNTDGSITSSVSANTTAGFSIVSYTGTGSATTIGHGLSTSPSMILVKNRSTAYSWIVYHKSLGATKNLYLDLTNASDTSSIQFNDTEPTSSVFSVGTSLATNKSGDNLIAYCFAEKKGYSKFGSYTGNGSTDGTFVYTGFKPAFFITKNSTDSGDNWILWDNKRDTFNLTDNGLAPNSSEAEFTDCHIDFVSNGIKIRNSTGRHNGTGDTHIYMAFAENPFVTSTGIPTTAR